MVDSNGTVLRQYVGLQDFGSGMAAVCPAEEALISVCSVHLVPGNLAAVVFRVVPLDEAAVPGFLQYNYDPDSPGGSLVVGSRAGCCRNGDCTCFLSRDDAGAGIYSRDGRVG